MRTIVAVVLALTCAAGCTSDRGSHRAGTGPTASASASVMTISQAKARFSALLAPVSAGIATLQPEISKAHPSLAVLRSGAASEVVAVRGYIAGLEAPGWPPSVQADAVAAAREAVGLAGGFSELAAAKTLAAAATAVRHLATIGNSATQRLRARLGLPVGRPSPSRSPK